MEHTSLSEMALRLGLAFVAGFIIGWERESHGRPAGLRTTILACVAAALAMMIPENLFAYHPRLTAAEIRLDPSRIGAGVLTGIGFLGAGTILRHERFVRGVTSAATLWFVTVLGLALGSGLYAMAGIGFVVALVTLYVLPVLAQRVESDFYSTLTVTAELDALAEAELRRRVETLGAQVLTLKLEYQIPEQMQRVRCELKLSKQQRMTLPAMILADLRGVAGLRRLTWE